MKENEFVIEGKTFTSVDSTSYCTGCCFWDGSTCTVIDDDRVPKCINVIFVEKQS